MEDFKRLLVLIKSIQDAIQDPLKINFFDDYNLTIWSNSIVIHKRKLGSVYGETIANGILESLIWMFDNNIDAKMIVNNIEEFLLSNV